MAESVDSEHAVAGLWSGFAASRDPELRQTLIRAYQPFAKRLAVRAYILRRDNSVSFGDYLQYAHIGLIEAVDRYEPERVVLFETFATYRIRGAILNGLAKESELAAQRQYWASRMRERVESLKSASPEGASVDAEVDAELEGFVDISVGLALGLLLEPPGEPVDDSPNSNPYVAAELGQLAQRVRGVLRKIPDRERQLIELHYFQHRPFQDIAALFKLTKGRVSQLHAQALKRLREELERERTVDREI